MNPEAKREWVEALRSGKYTQGKGRLGYDWGSNTEPHYCCLGVLCEIAYEKGIVKKTRESDGSYIYDDSMHLLPRSVQEWADVDDNPDLGEMPIADLNDRGLPFRFIADLIERYL